MAYKWVCVIIAFWIAVLVTVFLFKYMPRTERIIELEKALKKSEKRGNRVWEQYTLEVIGRTDDAACYAIQMAEKQGELDKQKGLAAKWAAEAEKFRRKAEGAEK